MGTYIITDYGAVADGITVCTKAIQKAIDVCDKGGVVVIPQGTFISGALFLKSNMTLYLEKGARLLGSSELIDFPVIGYSFEGYEQLCYASLLNTHMAPNENITIEGEGVIDANGETLFALEMQENKGKRGRALYIRNTTGLTLRDCTIRQSPAWCVHLHYCKGVVLDNVKIHSKYDENGRRYEGIFNGDGLDLDSCQNVKVQNCMIASQDDCIAIKSGRDVEGRRVGIPSKNIVIENSQFKSGFGVVMGSEMSGGIENVVVRNCTFEDTFSLASLKVTRQRGSYIRNIRYENCFHVNRDEEHKDCKWFRGAIYMDAFYGYDEFDADTPAEITEGTPVVENIEFRDLTVDTIGGNAIYLCGLPESPFINVHMENIQARGIKGMVHKNIENLIMENVQIMEYGV